MLEHTPDCHLVKLGTMGEYGMPEHRHRRGLPRDRAQRPHRHACRSRRCRGTLYHRRKVADSTNIHFASRIYGLRATDLNQGVVYGIHTEETLLDDRLLTRFDYDEQFRHRAQPVLPAGRGRPPADRLRQWRPDPWLPQPPRHPRLRRAGDPATPPTVARCGSTTSSPSPSRSASSRRPVQQPARSSGSTSRSVRSRTRAPRPRSTTTTRPTPSSSTSASSRTLLSEDLVTDTLSTLMKYQDRTVHEAIAPRTTWR